MRKQNGQIIKGAHLSPATEFKRGQHWRQWQPFRDKAWLLREYVKKQRSTGDIAEQFGCKDAAILFWLRKHEIPRRTVSEARAIKRWGVSGEKNPMYGKRDAANPRWKGGKGTRPQGRVEYIAWRKAVIERCGTACGECGADDLKGKNLHAHHLEGWDDAPDKRYDADNGIVLCSSCHSKVHHRQHHANGQFSKKGGK